MLAKEITCGKDERKEKERLEQLKKKCVSFLKKIVYVYFDREGAHVGEGQRERERESHKL